MVTGSKTIGKNIISVSRRTDIPCFYSSWFRHSLEKGFVVVENPFNGYKFNVSLKPQDVKGFVFWSRYPKGLIQILDFIDNKFGPNHYINFTINDYPERLEPRKPKLEKVFDLVSILFDKYGENYIKWRFDPIIVSNITPKEYILEKFLKLCKKLERKTKVCITSFVDLYSKVKRRMLQNRIILDDLDFEEKRIIIDKLRIIANEHGIELRLCCENKIAKELTIPTASCVNPFQFELDSFEELRVAPTRKDCTCYKSVDIGFYNTCLSGCLYCYSIKSYSNSLKNYKKILASKANFIQF
ncbi:MAG: DUF1848 domain-containing protein [Ignavibacteria bacterium]|nr:DUF1848 domain-containing protein [Ignavibacteria bacterium]